LSEKILKNPPARKPQNPEWKGPKAWSQHVSKRHKARADLRRAYIKNLNFLGQSPSLQVLESEAAELLRKE